VETGERDEAEALDAGKRAAPLVALDAGKRAAPLVALDAGARAAPLVALVRHSRIASGARMPSLSANRDHQSVAELLASAHDFRLAFEAIRRVVLS